MLPCHMLQHATSPKQFANAHMHGQTGAVIACSVVTVNLNQLSSTHDHKQLGLPTRHLQQ